MALKSRLPRIAAALEREVDAAVRRSMENVAQEARDRVPVDTGKLRNSIHVEAVEDGYAVTAGGGDVDYAAVVEFGGAKRPPRPFLGPSMEAQREESVRAVAAGIREAVE